MEGIFELIDQCESDMNGYHTLRAMKENARKGYFNGSRPGARGGPAAPLPGRPPGRTQRDSKTHAPRHGAGGGQGSTRENHTARVSPNYLSSPLPGCPKYIARVSASIAQSGESWEFLV